MKKSMQIMLIIVCSILLLSGCASMSKKFTGQQKANMGIFADHTIAMLDDADFGFDRDESVYTREFLGSQVEGDLELQNGLKEAGWFFGEIIDYSVGLVTIVETKPGEALIDEEYKEVILYQEGLEEEKYAILRSFGLLYLAYKGEPDAFDRLVAEKTIRRQELLPDGEPSIEELETIGAHLGKRLEAIHLIEQEIAQDWKNYRETHRELDKLHDKAIQQNRQARLITLVWLRAHQKMASGVTSPAEWFDIKTLPGQLVKMGTKAIF